MVMSWSKLRRQELRRANYECEFCGKTNQEQKKERRDDAGLHAYHIVPKRMGGKDRPGNIAILCDNCHAQWEARSVNVARKRESFEELRYWLTFLTKRRKNLKYRTG